MIETRVLDKLVMHANYHYISLIMLSYDFL